MDIGVFAQSRSSMKENAQDLGEILFTLPADAQLLQVSELSLRLQAIIGPVEHGQVVVSRPGFRVTTRLVTPVLARLMGEFREPSRLVDAVLRFSRAEARDPFATLDDAFEALATLIDGRVLVPVDSPQAQGLPASLAAGQTLAGYEIEALVHALEDGEVYRALEPDGTLAALKIARVGVSSALAHEAQVLAHLGGGDSPRLLTAGAEHGRAFVAMEWRPGVSVAITAQQARAAGDQPRLHRLVGAMLAAYGRLHTKGVVHGDIHPGNILVADDGRVTLLDFGRARLRETASTDPARAGIAHFYEPEMATALIAGALPPAASARGEQYALAALSYFLLTGLHAVEPTAEHQELLARIAARPPLPFVARGVAAWPRVEGVLRRAFSKDPRDRFRDVRAFAAAFRAAEFAQRAVTPPPDAVALLDGALGRILKGWDGESSTDSLSLAWLALRAALTMEDPNLLAAADLWASRAGNGWAAAAVRAKVARARCDSAAEAEAMVAFVKVAEPADGCATLLAVAQLLEGAESREMKAERLRAWAVGRLARLWTAGPPRAAILHAALAIGRTGAAPLPDKLRERLDALDARAGDTWLWALAHDVFADRRYAKRALNITRDEDDELAQLRRYQLTGDDRWLLTARRSTYAAARRLVAAPPNNPERLRTALLVTELAAPERAIKPIFTP